MPEGTTATPEAPAKEPTFNEAQVLQAGADKKLPWLSSEEHAPVAGIRGRLKARFSGKKGKEVFQAAHEETKRPTLTLHQLSELQLRFGGGKVTVNEYGRAVYADDITEDERKSFEEATHLIEGIGNYLVFSDIRVEAARTGKTIAQVINDRRAAGDDTVLHPRDYARFREQGLDFILSLPMVNRLFPQINSITDIRQRRHIIEAYLARDPNLRDKILDTMVGIHQKSKELINHEEDEQLITAQENKREAEVNRDTIISQISTSLEAVGLTLDDATKKRIVDLLADGRPLGNVLQPIFDHTMYNPTEFPHLREIINLNKARRDYDQAEAKVEKLDMRRHDPETRETTRRERDEAKAEMERLEKELEPFDEEIKRLQSLQERLNTNKDSSGQYAGEIVLKIEALRANQNKLKEADTKIKERERIAARKAPRDQETRLKKEADLLEDLKDAAPSAIQEVLEERHDQMVEKAQEEQKELRERAAKEEEEAVQKGIEVIGKVIDTRWTTVDRDNRKTSRDHDRIREDMRVAVYDGPDGIKKRMAQELGFKTEKRDDKGEIMRDAHGNPEFEVVHSGNIKRYYAHLSEAQRKVLDRVYANQGGNYVKRLSTEYFLERGFMDKFRWGDFNLRNHEWEMLNKNFGDLINQGLANSKQAQNVLQEWEKNGIKPTADKKWILWILALLGALGLGVAGTALGTTSSIVRRIA